MRLSRSVSAAPRSTPSWSPRSSTTRCSTASACGSTPASGSPPSDAVVGLSTLFARSLRIDEEGPRMGIAITDDHRELAEVARGFLTSQKARWAARSLLDASDEPRPGFWQNLAELGWLGLHVDEEYGGSGFGLPELVVVVEELGRAVDPGPFVPTVIASALLAAAAPEALRTRLLPGLVDGSVRGAVGLGGELEARDGALFGPAGVLLGA